MLSKNSEKPFDTPSIRLLANFIGAVDDVAEHLTDLRDDGPEGRRGDADQFEQSVDDELDRVVEEPPDRIEEPAPQAARRLAQLLDLLPGGLHRVARVVDQFLVERIPRRLGLGVEIVELLAERLLLLGRPRGILGGELGGEYCRDLLAGVVDDLVGDLDDAVDVDRDAGNQLADVVAEVRLGGVVGLLDPVGQAGDGVPPGDEEPADPFVAFLDLVRHDLEVVLEPARDGRQPLGPLVHRRRRHVAEQVLDT